jgi:hypothetical protein
MQGSWITVFIGGLMAMAPQIVSALPPEYRDIASGVVAAAVAAWHLYQPSPSSGLQSAVSSQPKR